MEHLTYEYEFDFGDDGVVAYTVEVDETSLTVQPEAYEGMPEWTDLEHNQCDNCPLSRDDKTYCPVAASISRVVETFQDRISHQDADVRVTVPERTYEKTVPLQYGLFSLLGLIMATSTCPHMRFLRPMARFHLPFATPKETIVRTVSFFLMRRYFESQHDAGVAFGLDDLDAAYNAVQAVNRGIVRRIRSVTPGDADANAIIILDTLAMLLSQSLASNLDEIEPMFA